MEAFALPPAPNCLLAPIRTPEVQAEDLKHLRRAAFLYQELYVQLKELTYNRVLLDIREENPELHVTKDGTNLFACKGEHAVRRFPRHLFNSQNKAEAMLLYRGCQDFLYMVRPLFARLIRPYCLDVFLRWAIPKNTQLRVSVHTPDNTMFGKDESNIGFRHDVALLTTPSGVKVIFDPTGAQYGWRDTLVPAAQYTQERISKIGYPLELMGEDLPLLIEDWSTEEYYLDEAIHLQDASTLPRAVDTIRAMILSGALKDFSSALAARGFSSPDGLVFHTDEEVFRGASRAILDETKAAMRANAAMIESSALFKVIPFGLNYRDFKVTTSAEVYESWKGVWLTRQEAAACSTRGQALALFERKLHQARLD